MIRWGAEQEARARVLIDEVVAGGPSRLASWRGLMALVAPFVEQWARASRLLRRCRLAGDDDARAVMVAVLERLAASEHANLRAFQKREAAAHVERDELVDSLERLGRLEDEEDDRAAAAIDAPVKGWLLRLVDYTARDHVRRRFGWAEAGGGPTKRDLHSDAARLDSGAELGARPPMTDRLTVSKLVAEVQAYMASFPGEMQSALSLWLDDHGFDEIAAELALADAEKARALVRAGQARLRERFRGRAPLFS
ncbi:MAG TPA: hypothetical protein VM261_22360 [Kofleriaceae bacterium]|nr:hypothetical protein [Kofleriaceae bacterium]